MLIRVNEILVDPRGFHCNRINRDGEDCKNTIGENGIIEIAHFGDVTKVDATCGTHINTRAGDDVRYRARMNATDSATMINSANQ